MLGRRSALPLDVPEVLVVEEHRVVVERLLYPPTVGALALVELAVTSNPRFETAGHAHRNLPSNLDALAEVVEVDVAGVWIDEDHSDCLRNLSPILQGELSVGD